MAAKAEGHHKKLSLCASRPKYREARWERAIKVYTINLESKFLLIQGVPALDVTKDLLETFAIYGTIDEYRTLNDYPVEEFTKVYWIKFQHIMAARKAKRKLDNRSFFGGILHVSYAPEFESVEETREKLMDRKRIVQRKLNYARKQSESQHASLHNDDSTASCSGLNMTEIPDCQSIASSSLTTHRETVDEVGNESTYTPFPPRLPSLSVPTYPSQVSTMSTSLTTPQTSTNHKAPSATSTLQQRRAPPVEARPVTAVCRKSYNSDVRFPARPSNQGVSCGPTRDDVDNIDTKESLTGDLSLDRTVFSIREKLNKVNKRSITETQVSDKKKKQRKRI